MIRRLLTFLLAFSTMTVASGADGPDLSYSKTIHYQIKGGAAGYRLSSETTVQRTALTERAARAHAFDVVEQPFTTISGLRGESRGRDLKQDRITFHFPRLEDTFTFSEDGKVRVTEEKTFQGSNAYSVRRSLADLTREETEKLLKGLLTYTEGKVEFTKYEFVDQSDYKKPLKVHLEYVIDNLVTLTPEEVLFNTGGLFAPASRLKTKVAPKDRQNPVRIYYDEASRKNIVLTFPASWRLSRVPQDFRLENRFGSISGSYKSSSRKLQVQQALTLKKSFEPKERIEDLLELTGNHSKLYVPTLVFKVKG